MRARAPGKLVLTGAYAVLDGAPAIVAAVDRYVFADALRVGKRPAPEVLAALTEGEPVPEVDASALRDGEGRKLGLGSSAASVVATVAVRALVRGDDVRSPNVRSRIFAAARAAHARTQGGGSGVDVAASVYGGILRYVVNGRNAEIGAVKVPPDLVLAVYFSGSSARTSLLLKRVAAAAVERPGALSPVTGAMNETATEAAGAIEAGNTLRFVSLARSYGGLLASLGRVADAPIVPPAQAELASAAAAEGAALLPSGAGGGDVAVWLGAAPPSSGFSARAQALGLTLLPLSIDMGGVQCDFASA